MPKRLVATNVGMEQTPGNLSTLNAHYQAGGRTFSINSGPWGMLIDFTLISLNSANEIPLWVSDTLPTGFFILANGTLVYRNNSVNTNISIQHPLLVPTVGERKSIRIFGDGSTLSSGWQLMVNNVYLGVIPNSPNAGLTGMRCFLGSFEEPCCPTLVHALEMWDYDPGVLFHLVWDGSGQGAIQLGLTKAKANSASEDYLAMAIGGNNGLNYDLNGYRLIEDGVQAGSYCYAARDPFMDPYNATSIELANPIDLDWNTTSFSCEVEFKRVSYLYFLTSNTDISLLNFKSDGSIVLEVWNAPAMGFTLYPAGTVSANFTRTRFTLAWNHVTKTLTCNCNGNFYSKVLNTTNFPSWGGVIPILRDCHFATENENGDGAGRCDIYAFKFSVTGRPDIDVDFTNLRPPSQSQLRTVTAGANTMYYYDYVTPGGDTVQIRNPQTYIKWFGEENAIDYVGPTQPNTILVGPTKLVTLPFSTVESWFRINGLSDSYLTHTLDTTAGYVRNNAQAQYEFTYPGSVIAPITIRVKASVTGFTTSEYTESPTFTVQYRASELNFEPNFFDASAFDTDVAVSNHPHYDYFQSTAFQWQYFEMTYSDTPQSKLRKLKYYTGTQWTGVPIKMWNGTGWVEVALKACTATNTFTKISG